MLSPHPIPLCPDRTLLEALGFLAAPRVFCPRRLHPSHIHNTACSDVWICRDPKHREYHFVLGLHIATSPYIISVITSRSFLHLLLFSILHHLHTQDSFHFVSNTHPIDHAFHFIILVFIVVVLCNRCYIHTCV